MQKVYYTYIIRYTEKSDENKIVLVFNMRADGKI